MLCQDCQNVSRLPDRLAQLVRCALLYTQEVQPESSSSIAHTKQHEIQNLPVAVQVGLVTG